MWPEIKEGPYRKYIYS